MGCAPSSLISHLTRTRLDEIALRLAYAKTFSTKRNMQLVCSGWRSIAIEVVFELVVLASPAQSTRFLTVLEAVAQTSNYGRFVKNIIFLDVSALQGEVARRLLTLCPNIREFRSGGREYYIAADHFLSRMPLSGLVSLELSHFCSSDILIPYLRQCPNLEVLGVGQLGRCVDGETVKPAEVSLPRLHTLRISSGLHLRWCPLDSISQWDLPSLVTFQVENPPQRAQIPEEFGHRIRNLIITEVSSKSQTIPLISFPHLTELTVEWYIPPKVFTPYTFKQLKIFVLRTAIRSSLIDSPGKQDALSNLLAILVRVGQPFPALSVIRYADITSTHEVPGIFFRTGWRDTEGRALRRKWVELTDYFINVKGGTVVDQDWRPLCFEVAD